MGDKRITLYPFRKRDPLTGKWYRARWKAAPAEIEANGWVVDGPPHAYAALGPTSGFQARRPQTRVDRVEMHPHWESPPAIDETERFLAALFLRRYSAYCVRRGRYAQAQGAAALHRELANP